MSDLTDWLGEKGLEAGLRDYSLLLPDESLVSFREISNWRRGGAESFVAEGVIEYLTAQGPGERHFVAKAVLPPLGVPVSVRLEFMLERMELLEENGVPVPELYAIRSGTLFQQYVPDSVDEYATQGSMTEDLVRQLAQTASVLDSLGFHPLDFISDMRTDGKTCYYIDFGEDLGGATGKKGRCARRTLEKFCHKHRLTLPESF